MVVATQELFWKKKKECFQNPGKISENAPKSVNFLVK